MDIYEYKSESLQIRINQFKNKCVDQCLMSTSDYNKDESSADAIVKESKCKRWMTIASISLIIH
jgi:hypothetical protein